MHEHSGSTVNFWIDPLEGEEDLDGVLAVEEETFTNPWTKEMYAWELQNRSVCHIFVVRTPEQRVAGFCAFWLVVVDVRRSRYDVRMSRPDDCTSAWVLPSQVRVRTTTRTPSRMPSSSGETSQDEASSLWRDEP